MSTPTPPNPGGLWARLFSMSQTDQEPEEKKEAESLPQENISPIPAAPPPLATPVEKEVPRDLVAPAIPVPPPLATPVEEKVPPPAPEPVQPAVAPVPEPVQPAVVPVLEQALPPAEPVPEKVEPPTGPTPIPEPAQPPGPPPVFACPCCQSPLKAGAKYCDDCGFMLPDDLELTPMAAANSPAPAQNGPLNSSPAKVRLKERFELGELISDRLDIRRYRGMDLGQGQPVPVIILAAPLPEVAVVAEEVPVLLAEEEDFLPGFDDAPLANVPAATTANAWPSLAWEKELLEKANHPSLPGVLDYFVEDNTEYLVEEVPQGTSLWDAWDDPDSIANVRYGWLQQLAEALHALHQAGAILEGCRPDLITINPLGQVRITDLGDLLPLPLPANPPIRANLYTAPELILDTAKAGARSDLYSIGATLYALEYLHHDLEEKDFERQFTPRQVTDRFPDVHPLFPRLINKTFVRDPAARFPTDEMGKKDPSGFQELIKTLEVCRRTFDRVRLDIAAWTTTGMVRTGNEDAFAFLHGVEGRQDDVYEYALILLADGMGGYDAGEVAAALAIAELRKFLLNQPIFAGLAGKDPPPAANPDQVPGYKEVLQAALRHANKEVFTAARTPGKGKRGMGCTAEAVYIDNANVISGHVGDSRVYHLHQGRLIQLTRDQTLVNRLVELGQLTPEEAEHHDRKNELQQAIGGQPTVEPGLYHGRLKRGDWVLVCSDGLSNHISNVELEKMLTREAAGSAEEAARRLLNLVNLRGATDNATIVVVRAS